MSQPARPFSAHAQKLYKVIQRQAWLLFVMILVLAIGEYLWQTARATSIDMTQISAFSLTKNCLAGGVLAWISHWLFAKISLRHSGYQRRRQVVNSLYLAQVVKWLVTMSGFALIFLTLTPLKPLWVFIGYFTMQLGQILLLYRYNYLQH